MISRCGGIGIRKGLKIPRQVSDMRVQIPPSAPICMSRGVLAAQGFLIPLDLVRIQAGQPFERSCQVLRSLIELSPSTTNKRCLDVQQIFQFIVWIWVRWRPNYKDLESLYWSCSSTVCDHAICILSLSGVVCISLSVANAKVKYGSLHLVAKNKKLWYNW